MKDRMIFCNMLERRAARQRKAKPAHLLESICMFFSSLVEHDVADVAQLRNGIVDFNVAPAYNDR